MRVLAPLFALVMALAPASVAMAQEGSGDADQASSAIADAQGEIANTIEAWLEPHAPALLKSFAGNEAWRALAFLLTVAFVWVARRIIMRLTLRVLGVLTRKTENSLDDRIIEALDPPIGYFLVALGAYVSLLWFRLTPAIRDFADSAYRLAAITIVAWALLRMVGVLTDILARIAARTESDLDDYLVPLVSRVLRVVIIAMAIVIVLQELGFNVAGVLAGLGVGGLAFALAAQDTVANWFGALMIYTDRPFEVGDWIKTGELEGVVEDVGLRSTKVRTFSKTVVSVPNRALANDVIENFSRMPKRRVYFRLGVTYGTTPAMMEETLERIRDILRSHADVDQEFWLVKFSDFDDSALTIMIYYFTCTTDWDEYLSIRQDVNLKIMHSLAEIGVSVAFPSRSIYVENPDPDAIKALDARARQLHSARTITDDAHHPQIAPSEDATGS